MKSLPRTSQIDPTAIDASKTLFENQVLTMKEAAALMQVSVRTIQKRIANGTIPHKRIGKCIRFSRDQLLAWVAKGE